MSLIEKPKSRKRGSKSQSDKEINEDADGLSKPENTPQMQVEFLE
jgi:hypothetical protein